MSCLASVAVMIRLASCSPTLYRLFRAATGFGGTTQRAGAGSGEISDRTVTVSSDSDVATGLPWRFELASDPETTSPILALDQHRNE
jgi:cytochrome c oxidase assembly protein Cox11